MNTTNKKDFIKLVESLCGRHSRWEIWKDMTWIFATSISNAVDRRHWESRESRYMEIVRNYRPDEMDTFARLFALMVNTFELDGPQDFMGEIFMELGLGSDSGGQFFTPYSVCKMMAQVSMPKQAIKTKLDQQGYITVNDPACGAGATLIAAADVILNGLKINYQPCALFTAQDIDYTTGLMCYIQLSVLGCAGYVRIGDTLSDPMTGHVLFGDGGETTWYTPMYFHGAWDMRRQAVVMREQFKRIDRIMTEAPPPEDQPKRGSRFPAAIDTPPAATPAAPAIVQVQRGQRPDVLEGQLMLEI